MRQCWSFCLVACVGMLPVSNARAQLEITEIMFNPNDDFIWEWIEVRNTGGSTVDLDGYLGFNLNDAEPTTLNPTIDSSLAANTSIGPGEVAVIYDGNQNGFMGFPSFDDAKFRDAWNLSPTVPLLAANFWPQLSNTTGSPGQSVAFWPDSTAFQMDVTPVEDDPINNPGVFTNRVTSFANAAFSINYSTGFPAVDGMSSITWTGNGSNQDGAQWRLSDISQTGVTTSVEVQVPGIINSTDDVGNPGVAPPGTPTTAGLHITEIMYDPDSPEDDWEWIELHNSTGAPIDLAGWVVDDINGASHDAANIAAGSVPAGGTAILFNADDVSAADFAEAWGAGLNLVEVTNWVDMQLNNGGATSGADTIGLWDSFAEYDGDHNVHANVEVGQAYDESTTFPAPSNGPSIALRSLTLDPTNGLNWDPSFDGDLLGSFPASGVSGGGGTIVFHPGDDVGSPGSFEVVTTSPVDLDGDGDVDGNDLLLIQRTNPALIPQWESEYGDGVASLAAAAAVPEPASLVLLGFATALATITRRR